MVVPWSQPGFYVDRAIFVQVTSATQAGLHQVFQPLLARLNEAGVDGHEARAAVLDAAMPEHYDHIVQLARNPRFDPTPAFAALADIGTPTARQELRKMHDEFTNPRTRNDILRAVTRSPHEYNVEFLGSLLARRVNCEDNGAPDYALDGLRCIGTEAAYRAIAENTDGWRGFRLVQLIGDLGGSGTRLAVDAILRFDPGADEQLLHASCTALMRLTHVEWCDTDFMMDVFLGDLSQAEKAARIAGRHQLWKRWWDRNRPRQRIYGPDDPMPAVLPKVS